jgi:hypothetical protein
MYYLTLVAYYIYFNSSKVFYFLSLLILALLYMFVLKRSVGDTQKFAAWVCIQEASEVWEIHKNLRLGFVFKRPGICFVCNLKRVQLFLLLVITQMCPVIGFQCCLGLLHDSSHRLPLKFLAACCSFIAL